MTGIIPILTVCLLVLLMIASSLCIFAFIRLMRAETDEKQRMSFWRSKRFLGETVSSNADWRETSVPDESDLDLVEYLRQNKDRLINNGDNEAN